MNAMTKDEINLCNCNNVSMQSLEHCKDVLTVVFSIQYFVLVARLMVARKLFRRSWTRILGVMTNVMVNLAPLFIMFAASLFVLSVVCVPLLETSTTHHFTTLFMSLNGLLTYIEGKSLNELGLMYLPAFFFYIFVAIMSMAIGFS